MRAIPEEGVGEGAGPIVLGADPGAAAVKDPITTWEPKMPPSPRVGPGAPGAVGAHVFWSEAGRSFVHDDEISVELSAGCVHASRSARVNSKIKLSEREVGDVTYLSRWYRMCSKQCR